jgi:hypothetical protein
MTVARNPAVGILVVAALVCAAAAPVVTAQTTVPPGSPMTNEGVVRATGAVDSVFVERIVRSAVVDGGDFSAYLMARLGVRPIPPSLGFRVTVDTQHILLGGRIRDLPPQAAAALGPIVMALDPETPVQAEIGLSGAGPRAMRFRLLSVEIGGLVLPEMLLQPVLADVGRQYPALTASGRDLLVEIPVGGRITLKPGGIALTGP